MSISGHRPAETFALGMMTLAASAAIRIADRASTGQALFVSATWTLVALVLALLTRRRARAWRWGSAVTAAGAAVANAWHSGFEPSGAVAAMDVLLLAAAGGVLPALLAWSWQQRLARLAAALSAFVVLIATSYCDVPTAMPVVSLYAASAVTWLTLTHRGRTSVDRPMATVIAAVIGFACVCVGGSIGLAAAGVPAARALSGFLPSSGGTGDGSASARAGVGDGPDEVAGDHAASAGYDQTDRFSESAKDGLYDLFVEAYGKPLRPAEHQRMIGLKAKDVHVVEGSDRDDLRSGRAFELRRAALTTQQVEHAAGDAMLYVDGRTPLHLRLATFDRYADAVWTQSDNRAFPASLHEPDRDGWLPLIDRPDFTAAGTPERHRIKIARLPGPQLPLPPSPLRFKFGRIVKRDFFREGPIGVVRLARRTVPPGSVLDVESRTYRPGDASDDELASPSAGQWAADAPFDAESRRLIRSWVAGRAAGWQQVNAVVNAIRSRAGLIRGTAAASIDPVRSLLAGHSGDDTQFATATALVLRSLGYRIRLASGFYVRPDAVDVATGQTPVTARDVHCWPEIHLRTGAWLPLEPTPGYTLLAPRMSALEAVTTMAQAAIGYASRNAVWLLVITSGTSLLILFRRQLLDRFDVLIWRWRCRDASRMVRSTAALIERRARRWFQQRPIYQTRSAWLSDLGRRIGVGEHCVAFTRQLLADDFASGRVMTAENPLLACRVIESILSAQSLRRLGRRKPIH